MPGGEIQVPGPAPDLTVYAVVRNPAGLAWDTVSEAFVAFVDADVGRYDIPLVEQGTQSSYSIGDFPAAITTAGTYNVAAYRRAGGSPSVAADGAAIAAGTVRWDGTEEVDDAGSYEGRYITESEGDDFLSSIGVDVYSDGNGVGSRRASAVAFAIRAAEARADSRLADNLQSLAVPLDFGDALIGDIDANFKMQVLGYYAYFLASKRNLNGEQAPGVSFKQLRDDADKFFDDVWYGDAAIAGAAAGTPGANVPIAVPATVNADGLVVTAANVRGYRYVWDEALGAWR